MGWGEFIGAFLAFFLFHSVLVRRPVRERLVALLGETGFTWVFSLISAGLLYWFLMASNRAPHIQLWEQKAWQLHFTFIVMIFAVEILALSLNKPNPFSFGGSRTRNFNPRRAGLVQWMRHPVLVAIFIWSLAHIPPNGDLAHVLMFGFFAVFSVLGAFGVDRRKQHEMGKQKWQALLKEVRNNRWDLLGMNPQSAMNRLIIGMVAYSVLVWAHGFLFGYIKLG